MTKECPICEKSFEGVKAKEYCSLKCRKRAENSRRRRREGLEEEDKVKEFSAPVWAKVKNVENEKMVEMIAERSKKGFEHLPIILTGPSESLKKEFDLVQMAESSDWIYL